MNCWHETLYCVCTVNRVFQKNTLIWRRNKTEKQSKDALVKLIIYQFGYQMYNIELTVLNTKQLFNAAQFGSLRQQICNFRLTNVAIWHEHILQFWTNTFCHFEQIHKYIQTVSLGWPDWPFSCIEYKTDGDRAVKHEEWTLANFQFRSVSQPQLSVHEMQVHLKTILWLNSSLNR